jgi:hypothetical protein
LHLCLLDHLVGFHDHLVLLLDSTSLLMRPSLLADVLVPKPLHHLRHLFFVLLLQSRHLRTLCKDMVALISIKLHYGRELFLRVHELGFQASLLGILGYVERHCGVGS